MAAQKTGTPNPNADRDYIDKLDVSGPVPYRKFLITVMLSPFRHIANLAVDFYNPISIITGTNRSGKSTILMAIACSHLNFEKRLAKNGKLVRHTWSSLMKFTNFDKQSSDWAYQLIYRDGVEIVVKNGQRKFRTKKWNGVGKKEGQIRDRQVIFVDLDRILPARNFADKIFAMSKKTSAGGLPSAKIKEVEDYISYILEENFKIVKGAQHLDKVIYNYRNRHEYSSYNAASGEEVLIRMIVDIVEAENNALILIDEIEVGLHPKIQRRLMDVLYYVARRQNKQLIITTHSPTILKAVSLASRIFIERAGSSDFKVINSISVNAALSKMDAIGYPLVDLYCEDDVAESIILKAIANIIREKKVTNFHLLINIIVSGSVDTTYANFLAHDRTYKKKKIKVGYACVLDGDAKALKTTKGGRLYPDQKGLMFLYSEKAPEMFLLEAYLQANPNDTLEYHVRNSNPHVLFEKMVEQGIAVDTKAAFELCWDCFQSTEVGAKYFEELKTFLVDIAKEFSPSL